MSNSGDRGGSERGPSAAPPGRGRGQEQGGGVPRALAVALVVVGVAAAAGAVAFAVTRTPPAPNPNHGGVCTAANCPAPDWTCAADGTCARVAPPDGTCKVTSDCGEGAVCASGHCVPAGAGCKVAGDCPARQVCVAGECVNCNFTNCKDPNHCDALTGACVPPPYYACPASGIGPCAEAPGPTAYQGEAGLARCNTACPTHAADPKSCALLRTQPSCALARQCDVEQAPGTPQAPKASQVYAFSLANIRAYAPGAPHAWFMLKNPDPLHNKDGGHTHDGLAWTGPATVYMCAAPDVAAKYNLSQWVGRKMSVPKWENMGLQSVLAGTGLPVPAAGPFADQVSVYVYPST
jgi:hypothetical protein